MICKHPHICLFHRQVPSFYKECIWDCKAQLPDDLIQDERYEARIRVQASEFLSTWSDWSPTASWVALIGRAKPTPPGKGVE